MNIQLSTATKNLMAEMKAAGLPVNQNEPEQISVYYESDDPQAIIKWGSVMYPTVKHNINELDKESLVRDGVRFQRTWNWKG